MWVHLEGAERLMLNSKKAKRATLARRRANANKRREAVGMLPTRTLTEARKELSLVRRKESKD